MSVFKMKDKPHGKARVHPWCCELTDKGRRVRKYLKTKKEAEDWEAKEKERLRTSRLGLHSIQDLKKHKVREIVEGYIASRGYLIRDDEYECPDEETDLYVNYFLVLRAFARNTKYSSLNLYDFNKEVAEQYRDEMLAGTYVSHGSKTEKRYSPRTVRRNITIIQRAWKWAKKNNRDLTYLDNPWEGIEVRGATGGKRQRGLKKGELEKLIHGCAKCRGANKYYVELAVYFVIETGLRRQELERLTWGDIDFEERRITIAKSKTDKVTGNEGRVIVLPLMIELLLTMLAVSLKDGKLPGPERLAVPFRFGRAERIFPMSGDALSDAFDGVVYREGIEDLHFHDLRAAAESKFYRAGLNPKEIDIMKNGPKGHYDVLDVYLEGIQDKLEKHVLGGKNFEETGREIKEDWSRIVLEGVQRGLDEDTAVNRAKEILSRELKQSLKEAGLLASLSSGEGQKKSA
ncbi:hypothetical protein A1D31_29150 [Bradyrhizobium liaoningense]|nr:hypothetical protein A1D31_29150 [Bradyrhizobium liaoningense]